MTLPPLPPANIYGFYNYLDMQAYAAAAVQAEREAIAQMLDDEHERRRHMDNHAAYYARMIRARKETK